MSDINGNSTQNMDEAFTIERYLKGKVGIPLSDDTLTAITAENGIEPGTLFSDVSERERELCLAGLYVYASGMPATTQKVTDSDADWSHSEGGQMMSATEQSNYLRMANAIYSKYGLPTVGGNKWGMRGSGFHNIRNYGNPYMK